MYILFALPAVGVLFIGYCMLRDYLTSPANLGKQAAKEAN